MLPHHHTSHSAVSRFRTLIETRTKRLFLSKSHAQKLHLKSQKCVIDSVLYILFYYSKELLLIQYRLLVRSRLVTGVKLCDIFGVRQRDIPLAEFVRGVHRRRRGIPHRGERMRGAGATGTAMELTITP